MANIEITSQIKLPDGFEALITEYAKDLGLKQDLRIFYYKRVPHYLSEGRLGVFFPYKHVIMIDARLCWETPRWRGTLLKGNAYLNLLETTFHEISHALQCEEDGWIEKSELELEANADQIAAQLMTKWAEAGGEVPPLSKMGTLGTWLVETLNREYDKYYQEFSFEIDTLETTAAAFAELAAKFEPSYASLEEVASLLQCIDEGKVGLVINGERYLNAEEYLCLNY